MVMKDDLISRSALLAELSRRLSIVQMVGVDEIVESVPAVDAEPVVHAHWQQYVDEDEDWGDLPYFKCSACGTVELTGRKRCPECGAHMDEEVAHG